VEKAIYEQGWIEIYKNLNSWDTLAAISQETNNLELKLETLWQKKEFSTLCASMTSPYFDPSFFYYFCSGFNFLRIDDQKVGQAVASGFNQLIKEWLSND
jgi:hypothetical protein